MFSPSRALRGDTSDTQKEIHLTDKTIPTIADLLVPHPARRIPPHLSSCTGTVEGAPSCGSFRGCYSPIHSLGSKNVSQCQASLGLFLHVGHGWVTVYVRETSLPGANKPVKRIKSDHRAIFAQNSRSHSENSSPGLSLSLSPSSTWERQGDSELPPFPVRNKGSHHPPLGEYLPRVKSAHMRGPSGGFFHFSCSLNMRLDYFVEATIPRVRHLWASFLDLGHGIITCSFSAPGRETV